MAFVSFTTLFARLQPVACRNARIVLLSSDPHCFDETSAHRSPIRSPQVRTRCFRAQALHLPYPLYPMGFAMGCQLARRPGLVCSFCPSPRTFALRLPPDTPSRACPCLRLVVIIDSICRINLGTPTGVFHPITSRPCWAHTRQSSGPARKAAQVAHFYVGAHQIFRYDYAIRNTP